jgi:hypothetical protein
MLTNFERSREQPVSLAGLRRSAPRDSLRERLIKIGEIVSHGRLRSFQLAEVAVSRQVSPISCLCSLGCALA